MGEAPLKVQFPRLFDLTIDKDALVSDMERRGWADGGGAWVWRRRLLAWEEETVTECATLLSDIVLQDTILDRWRWGLDPTIGYSVKGTYQYLTSSDSTVEQRNSNMVWLKHVPVKVSVFVWRLFRNRLPTKDNLIRRMVLQQEDNGCVGGCGNSDSAVHFILRCVTFGSLWHLIYKWVGISFISPDRVTDHFHQFGLLAGLPRYTHTYLQVIWQSTVWVIWKERNNRIFTNKARDLICLLDSVKFLSFSWLQANLHFTAFSYNDWWRNPLLCMGLRD